MAELAAGDREATELWATRLWLNHPWHEVVRTICDLVEARVLALAELEGLEGADLDEHQRECLDAARGVLSGAV